MWERRPNFVVHCGDVVDDGAAKWQWTGDLFKPCNELFGRVPVFPCIGNHEKNHAHYYKYFSLPKPEYYYSYKYGNAEFFVLDTNTNRTSPPDRAASSTSGSTRRWRRPTRSGRSATTTTRRTRRTTTTTATRGRGRRRPATCASATSSKLYEKYNVDVVFNGHIHVYERTWPIRGGKVDQKTGVTYVTSGGGGGKLENFAPTPAFFKQEFRSDYHFCYVDDPPRDVQLEGVRPRGPAVRPVLVEEGLTLVGRAVRGMLAVARNV